MKAITKETTAQNSRQRNSSIELLRIIAMIMIVFHHFAIHGSFSFSLTEVSASSLWVLLLSSSGKIGVDVFVLISGYFLVSRKGTLFDLRQLLKLWGQIAFYSVGIYLIFVLVGWETFSAKTMIKSFIPVSTARWWFASTYFVMYMFHPFLNRFLHALDKPAFKCYLSLMVVCWSFYPTFAVYNLQLNKLLWFVCLYSIGAYIRIHGLNPAFRRFHYFAFGLAIFVIMYLGSLLIRFLSIKLDFLLPYIDHLYMTESSLFVLLISISLFMVFEKTELRYNRTINLVASATFGVYLIHENDFVRILLWNDLFRNAEFQNSPYLIPYSILAVLLVFTLCSFIDLLRKHLLEKPFMKLVDKYIDKLTNPAKNPFIKVADVVFGKDIG